MAGKLGLETYVRKTDDELVSDLQSILQLAETDMTIFYRRLAEIGSAEEDVDDELLISPLRDAYYVPDQLTPDVTSRIAAWLRRYKDRVRSDGTSDGLRKKRMNATNPKYVLRNYLAQLAIDKSEEGDHSMIDELLELLRHPYDEQPEMETYAEKRPDWARRRPGCSMLSCSS